MMMKTHHPRGEYVQEGRVIYSPASQRNLQSTPGSARDQEDQADREHSSAPEAKVQPSQGTKYQMKNQTGQHQVKTQKD
jgi:hypothetical protein